MTPSSLSRHRNDSGLCWWSPFFPRCHPYPRSLKNEKLSILSSIKLLHELPFYDELSAVEISKAFKRYAKIYKVEIIEPKHPLVQLEASKLSIKGLFKDLLNEMKGFKYQIKQTVLLLRHKMNGDTEYTPVYFNSATKTVINSGKYDFDKSFQEILYRIDNWINGRSGWIIESVEGEYVNISVYNPLIGSTYIELPSGLKNPAKGLINIKNNDKCFLWCHIRHLNLVERYPERITKEDKNMVDDLIMKELIMKELNFLFQKKITAELKNKIIFVLMCFVLKMD